MSCRCAAQCRTFAVTTHVIVYCTLFTTYNFYNNCSVNLERETCKSAYSLLTRCYSKKNCVYSEYSTALVTTIHTDNISLRLIYAYVVYRTCISYVARCKMYIVRRTMYAVYCTLYAESCIMYAVHRILCNVHCTLHD